MSQLPDQTPRLPKLPFLIGDAALLILAYVIATHSAAPFASPAIIWIVVCVIAAAILGAIPFLADYARRQDEALDERQRALEALTRTLIASAEQISIATQGLHALTELTQKHLKQAEQLPQRLQEKINEFKLQLDEGVVAENEALQQEVNALRASEAEKLETATDKIHRSVAEFAKLEAAAAKHLAEVSDTLAKVPASVASSQAEAVRALQAAGVSLTTALVQTAADAVKKIESAQVPLPVFPVAPVTPAAAVESEPEVKPTPLSKRAKQVHVEKPEPAPEVVTPPSPPEESPAEIKPAAVDAPAEIISAPDSVEPILEDTPAATPAAVVSEPTVEAVSSPVAEPAVEPEPSKGSPPVISASAEAAPVAAVAEPAPAPTPDATVVEPTDEPLDPKPPKPKKVKPTPPEEPSLGLDIGAGKLAEDISAKRSEDGVTRLLVTAYIGIGNRLYIRGSGPGLNPDKGHALQFVSIGKWRWETADATAPVTYKIYKNDTVECHALGEQMIEPGQEQEVTATF